MKKLENFVCKARVMPRTAPVVRQCTPREHLFTQFIHETVEAVNYTNSMHYNVKTYLKWLFILQRGDFLKMV